MISAYAPDAPRPDGTLFLDAEVQPSRPLSPAGFWTVMGVLGLLAMIPGIVFTAMGAWPVAGFLGLDVIGVYWAFRMSYAQGRARERVRVGRETVAIERTDPKGRTIWRAEFPSYWARVTLDTPLDHDSQLRISASGRSAVVGRWLSIEERVSLSDALKAALAQARGSLPSREA
jgi:uncharacterized membrane protein